MWISSTLQYKNITVKKKSIFGYISKSGYELTEPLLYRYNKDTIFILPTGYVFDGPSYPNFLELVIGKKNAESLLAASAMHDTMNNMPTLRKHGDVVKYKSIRIVEGAKLYRRMISQWDNDDEKPNNLKRRLQYAGLLAFQRIYSLFISPTNWEKITKN